jgi:hypothetical protein
MRADFEVFRNPEQEAKDFVQVANESDDARLGAYRRKASGTF